MAKFKLTNKAVADLNGIWEYTADKCLKNKRTNIIGTYGICKWIADNPTLGKTTLELPYLFGFKENKHIIFFRTLEKDLIEITRILHERMDLKNRMEE
ncbi:type II toxin-antitoxin system RelE/ParE family toxin [Winogradskyella maritima]|nr:type II toxin-antitoxin system RelE/ParE family toxin [Winogradskyella maritima]